MSPGSLSYANSRVDARARAAVRQLGDALRRASGDRRLQSMLRGQPCPRTVFDALVGANVRVELVDAGLATDDGAQVTLAFTIVPVGDVFTVIPKHAWGDEVVYLGPDSAHLIEAVLRLAPRGEYAADLGTGTGLLATLLASRYRAVVGTDMHPSVVAAAMLTFALNAGRAERAGQVSACLADVGAGLRPGSFDLVGANAPWVPLASTAVGSRELFAHGGETGVELPLRFLSEGTELLAPGGVSVTMALDVRMRHDTRFPERPLAVACQRLRDRGFFVATIETPFNRERPHLIEQMRSRQPALAHAAHVAVVVRRPHADETGLPGIHVAAEALRSRWAMRPVEAQLPD